MTSLLDFLTESVSWLTLTVAVICSVLVYIYVRYSTSNKGPLGWPYIGYYPYLKDEMHHQLSELARTYGDVFCFRVTGQLYVHLNTLQAVREAHITKSECFAGRTTNFNLIQDLYCDGVGFLNGEPWKVLKKFFTQTFKEFGMGKDVQENVVVDRVQNVLDVLKHSDGKDVDAIELFTENCNHVIRQLLFSGGKTENDDYERINIAYKKVLQFIKGPKILLAGSVAKHFIFPYMKGFRDFAEGKEEMMVLLQKFIQQHEDTFDKDNLRDLVDYYINERRTFQEKEDPKANIFTDRALVYSLVLIYGDSSVSVGWLIADTLTRLAKYPDVQKKIQSEIDEVVGRHRLPNSSDRNRLHYLSATLHEVLRTTTTFPIIPSLECTKETVIHGQQIPKGTVTLVNAYSINHDPKLYDEPHKFDPSRFMSTKGNTKAELPISFGIGKRYCAGESLTNMEVFLFVAAILQNFDLHPVKMDTSPGVEEIDVDWKMLIRAIPRTT